MVNFGLDLYTFTFKEAKEGILVLLLTVSTEVCMLVLLGWRLLLF